MAETPAQVARPVRPVYVRGPKGHFTKGAPGRLPGYKNRQTRVNMELLKAIAEKHFPRTLEKLLRSKSERIKFEAIRWVGEMILGRPRQSLEVGGGLSDLAAELGAALRAVRERREAMLSPSPALITPHRVETDKPIEVKALPETSSDTCLSRAEEASGEAIPAAIPEVGLEADRALAADVASGPPVVAELGKETS